MKRNITLVLMLSLIFAMAACGQTVPNTSSSDEGPSASQEENTSSTLALEAEPNSEVMIEEEEIGQAIRAAIDDGLIKREELFVITKIWTRTNTKAFLDEEKQTMLLHSILLETVF